MVATVVATKVLVVDAKENMSFLRHIIFKNTTFCGLKKSCCYFYEYRSIIGLSKKKYIILPFLGFFIIEFSINSGTKTCVLTIVYGILTTIY